MILSTDNLVALTGRKRRSAQVRQLKAMGIPHRLRSYGSPVVLEADEKKHRISLSMKQVPKE